MDIKIKNTIPLTIVQNKKIKHLGLNQPKHIQSLSAWIYKMLLKVILKVINKWRDILCSWVVRHNIIKMWSLLKFMYNFKVVITWFIIKNTPLVFAHSSWLTAPQTFGMSWIIRATGASFVITHILKRNFGHAMQHAGSSTTRGPIHGPYRISTEFQPPDCQGSPLWEYLVSSP